MDNTDQLLLDYHYLALFAATLAVLNGYVVKISEQSNPITIYLSCDGFVFAIPLPPKDNLNSKLLLPLHKQIQEFISHHATRKPVGQGV